MHSDAYRVRSGLNSSHITDTINFDDFQERVLEVEEFERKNNKKKFKGGESTIEKNLSNINVDRYDLEFDTYPLFQKASAKFDN